MLTPDQTSQLAVLIAGILWPFVFQWVKSYPGWDGRLANAVSLLFCFVLALGIDAATLPPPLTAQVIFLHGTAIIAISQAIYKQVIQPPATPPDTTK